MADYAMARYRKGDGIGRAGLCYGAHRLRRADALRDGAIADRRSRRNLAQCLPHALLEGRAADIERQVESQRRRFNEAHDFRHEFLKFPRRRR